MRLLSGSSLSLFEQRRRYREEGIPVLFRHELKLVGEDPIRVATVPHRVGCLVDILIQCAVVRLKAVPSLDTSIH